MRTFIIAILVIFGLAACATDPHACKHNPEVSSCKHLPNDFGEGASGDGGEAK